MISAAQKIIAEEEVVVESEFRYGCCIDAGSSGSRIYLYRWLALPQRQPSPPTTGDAPTKKSSTSSLSSSSLSSSLTRSNFIQVERKAIFSQERTPGIGDELGLGIQAVRELASLAKAALPSEVDPKSVPIYLGATAGMRIIMEDSTTSTTTTTFAKSNASSKQHAVATIIADLRTVLHQSGFAFQDSWARTISGEEEGVYAWLVANYLKYNGNFPPPPPTLAAYYGALDLGGASAQISFLISKKSDDTKMMTTLSSSSLLLTSTVQQQQQQQQQQQKQPFPLRIAHLEYPLYSQSLLYYGVDQARMLYDATFASDKVPNPCYPSGYKDELSLISGSSDWERCLNSVSKMFYPVVVPQLNETHVPFSGAGEYYSHSNNIMSQRVGANNHYHQKFIAMSTFVYTWDYLGLRIGSETDDLVTLKAQARRVCNMTHTQQMARYEQHMEYKATKRRTTKPHAQCFNAAYTYHLLTKVFGLPIHETPIEIYYEIGGTKVQWALGLMLVEVNKMGAMTFHQTNIMHNQWSCEICTYHFLLAIMFLALIFVAWNLGYYHILPHKLKRSTSDNNNFLPLVVGIDRDDSPVESKSPRKGR